MKMELDFEDDLNDEEYLPADILDDASTVNLELLPEKSRGKYERAYKTFSDWRTEKNVGINEKVMLSYFLKQVFSWKLIGVNCFHKVFHLLSHVVYGS